MSSADAGRRVIVFDGICHVCSGWVSFLSRHRIDPPFELLPMQSDAGRELLLLHGINADDPATFLVLDRGLRLTESDAAIHVIKEIGSVWRIASLMRILPQSWRDSLYRLLARNRYRWFGRRDTRFLPPP